MHLFFIHIYTVFCKDIAFHWPSQVMANGEEWDSYAKGISIEREVRKGYATKESAEGGAWPLLPGADAVGYKQPFDHAKHRDIGYCYPVFVQR